MKKCNESILSLMEMPNEESVTRYFKVKLSNSEESSLYLSKVYTDTSDDEFIGYPYSLSEKIMINENTDNYMSYVVSNRTRDAFDCAFCMSQDIDFEDWVCIKEDNDFLNAWNAIVDSAIKEHRTIDVYKNESNDSSNLSFTINNMRYRIKKGDKVKNDKSEIRLLNTKYNRYAIVGEYDKEVQAYPLVNINVSLYSTLKVFISRQSEKHELGRCINFENEYDMYEFLKLILKSNRFKVFNSSSLQDMMFKIPTPTINENKIYSATDKKIVITNDDVVFIDYDFFFNFEENFINKYIKDESEKAVDKERLDSFKNTLINTFNK